MNIIKTAFCSALFLLVLFSSCKKSCDADLIPQSYSLELIDSIFTEVFDDSNKDANRYNANNIVYTNCSEFTYEYYYEDLNGNPFLYEFNDKTNDWDFVQKTEAGNNAVTLLKQTIIRPDSKEAKNFFSAVPYFPQTLFRYDYLTKKGSVQTSETTGIIENEKDTWVHPPRSHLLFILQLNPFPYIRTPFEIGTSWNWDYLSLSNEYAGDPRWLEWEGQMVIGIHYEITDIVSLSTAFGDLECYEVTGIGSSDFGETKLVSYFNTEYGFVKLDYTNIDYTKVIIDLIDKQ